MNKVEKGSVIVEILCGFIKIDSFELTQGNSLFREVYSNYKVELVTQGLFILANFGKGNVPFEPDLMKLF